MRDLSITQEYLICAMHGKGKISGFNVEKLVCVVASGLLELKMENCIVLEKKKVRVTGELPAKKMYLKPLYNFINQPKPVKIEKIIEEYNYSFSDRKLRELIGAVGTSLEEMGLVSITESGIISKRKKLCSYKTGCSLCSRFDQIRTSGGWRNNRGHSLPGCPSGEKQNHERILFIF